MSKNVLRGWFFFLGFFRGPVLVPSTTATVDANQSMNYESANEGGPDLPAPQQQEQPPRRLRSRIWSRRHRASARSATAGRFPGTNAVWGRKQNRKAETKKGAHVNKQRVLGSDDGASGAPRNRGNRRLVSINALGSDKYQCY